MVAKSTPYRLVVTSPSGGTAKTTTALALAWLAQEQGHSVRYEDAGSGAQIPAWLAVEQGGSAASQTGRGMPTPPATRWQSLFSDAGSQATVNLAAGVPTVQLVVVDTPPVAHPKTRAAMEQADGVLVTCSPEPVSLRSLGRVADMLTQAREHQKRLAFLGLLLVGFDGRDDGQQTARIAYREQFGPLLLDDPIPYQRSMAEWPLQPTGGLPPGPAIEAYRCVLDRLTSQICLGGR